MKWHEDMDHVAAGGGATEAAEGAAIVERGANQSAVNNQGRDGGGAARSVPPTMQETIIREEPMDNEKTVNGAGESSPAPDGSAADLVETWNLVRDLRNALAAAMRTIAARGTCDEFLAEARGAGVENGIGDRSRSWLDSHSPPNAPDQARLQPSPESDCSASPVAQPPRDVSELYSELLYAVARKFPGESRHETALRYIRDTEERVCEAGSCKQNAETHGRAARTVQPLVGGYEPEGGGR